jgi:hypothetical protein
MNRVVSRALAVTWLLATGAGAAGAAGESVPQFAHIEEARASGRLDDAEALFHRLQYVFDGENLPPELQPESRLPIRCATALVAEYEAARAGLPAAIVKTVDAWLAGPGSDKLTYISPSGIFRVSYLTTSDSAVPLTDVAPANGIPDYVERIASYLDEAWRVEIDVWGFEAPIRDPYYAVMFSNQPGTYGYTQSNGTTTRIVLENDYAGFPPNDDPDGDTLGAAKVTCAHEFKHASQYRASLWVEGWWLELDATWAEDLVFDATNDYYLYVGALASGISAPGTPLNEGGAGSYEDCIWQHWMSETWTPQVIVDLWDRRQAHPTESMLASYDAVLGSRGSSFATEYPVFAAWNYATGTRAIPALGYAEAAGYATGPATEVAAYPATLGGQLAHLSAANYRCLGFTPGEPGDLRIDFDGDDGQQLALMAVIRRHDGSGLLEPIALGEGNVASAVLPVPLGDLAEVGLVVVNAGVMGDDKAYSLTVRREVAPLAALDAAAVQHTQAVDTQANETVTLTNPGPPGSSLVYTAHVVDRAPEAAFGTAGSQQADRAASPLPRRAAGALKNDKTDPVRRQSADCVFGNDDTGSLLGYYDTWWTGNESYAKLIDPREYACSCGAGFDIEAVHMLLRLDETSAPLVRVSLATQSAICSGPGTILESSAPVTLSGYPADAYYDVAIPVDFSCRDLDAPYFLVFEFLDDAGPVGLPVNQKFEVCRDFNEYGSGWVDMIGYAGFAGNLLIWADVACCGVPEAEVRVLAPDGGEVLAAGDSLRVDWTATGMAQVRISLSRDGGARWQALAHLTPNDGTETFVVAGPPSQDCLVRVGSPDGTATDQSAGPFWIHGIVPWLTMTPTVGVVESGAGQPLTLSFDTSGLPTGSYQAWLLVQHNAVSSPEVVPVSLTVPAASAAGAVPRLFALRGAVPNPFNPTTRLVYSLHEAGPVLVDVLDLRGRLVRTLVDSAQPAGEWSVEWNGRDGHGRPVASGSYLARLRAGGRTATRKLMLAR